MNGIEQSGEKIIRSFQNTTFIGEGFMPGFISTVRKVVGSYIYSDQGLSVGTQSGVKCYIYEPGKTKDQAIAVGNVIQASDGKCTIEITQPFKTVPVKENYIVELDVIQWMNDK